jgi:Bacterial Ig-like domain (group 3)
MRLRFVVLGASILAVMLGGAGCSSSGANTTPGSQSARPPVTGMVVVKSGGRVVCVMKLSNGKGTCTMNTGGYPSGTVPLVASYGGSKQYKPAQSETVNLRLTKK